MREVQHRYSLIGSSPLTRITQAQADGCGARARRSGLRRHAQLASVYRRHAEANDRRRHRAGSCDLSRSAQLPHQRRSLQAGLAGAERSVSHRFRRGVARPSTADRSLRRELACRLGASLRANMARTLPVLFTAHSVPQRTIAEGDPYETQTRETAALVAAQVPEIGEWHFAFQSQGMSGGEWLGPTVEDTITRLRAAGHNGRVSAADWLCLRSCGDSVRYRHSVPAILPPSAA